MQATPSQIPESALQEYAEALCIDYGLHYIHIPQSVLEYIYGSPKTPRQVVDDANAYLNGFPDLLIMDSKGHTLCLELKRDDARSKLRASQKRFLMGKNSAICRTKQDIKAIIEAEFM